jgi:hypothetical protein
MWAAIIRFLMALVQRTAADDAPEPRPTPVAPLAAALARMSPAIDLAALQVPHRVFDAASSWALVRSGLSVNGRPPVGTPGEPATARRAFEFFGHEFRLAAREFGVPIELIVACACAEAGIHIRQGREAARLSERREPGFVSYEATPHRVSVGVMHTLVSTAREALRDPSINQQDLRTPAISIRAGTAYIARQLAQTGGDPPLVAAAYNAGGVYDDPTPGLPFSLRDFPFGDDRHIERFVALFNDVCGLIVADPGLAGDAPSFVRVLS